MEGKEFQRFEQLETRVNKVKIQKTELTKKKNCKSKGQIIRLCARGYTMPHLLSLAMLKASE